MSDGEDLESTSLRIVLAQLDLLVGDVQGNLTRIVNSARTARDEHHADLTLFPELALSGYPPEDLLFHRGLRVQLERALQQVCREVPAGHLVVGFPEYTDHTIANAAALLGAGRVVAPPQPGQGPVIQALHPQGEPVDAQLDPGSGQTLSHVLGVGLDGDLSPRRDREVAAYGLQQAPQEAGLQSRRSASAEIDGVEAAAGRKSTDLGEDRLRVALLEVIATDVDGEVAVGTAAAAERHVQIERARRPRVSGQARAPP